MEHRWREQHADYARRQLKGLRIAPEEAVNTPREKERNGGGTRLDQSDEKEEKSFVCAHQREFL